MAIYLSIIKLKCWNAAVLRVLCELTCMFICNALQAILPLLIDLCLMVCVCMKECENLQEHPTIELTQNDLLSHITLMSTLCSG